MVALTAPLLSAVLLAQSGVGPRIAGAVLDVQGKPIAGAVVVLYAPPMGNFKGEPARLEARAEATAGSISRPHRLGESTRTESTCGRSNRVYRSRPWNTRSTNRIRSCCEKRRRDACGLRDRMAKLSPACGSKRG